MPPVHIQGIGLHTGARVNLHLHPAASGSGFRFCRTDLPGAPEFTASADLVFDTRRGTSLRSGNAEVHTVEHLISALAGLRIHACLIELDGPEIPILDGSSRPFVEAIRASDAFRENTPPPAPLRVTRHQRWEHGASSIEVFPHDRLSIECVSADDRGFHHQTLRFEPASGDYASAIAPARTFTFYEDIAPLLAAGKIKGGSLDCAIVIRDGVPEAVGGLRFPDEFVRHKLLDLIGDLSLTGRPLQARIVAIRPGHGINNRVARDLESATLD
jgi:UDP-3-O-[3-hydroxymyristoyl] N-acetylglucosamine deacetylase / 3-hydroxyacyl-[acyl-carrier-protein] dehydratase